MCALLWAEEPSFKTVDNFKDFIMEGALNAKTRMYYMNRHFDTSGHTQESMAIGEWLDYETPYWYGIGAGGALYISQGAFFIDSDRDGA